MLCLQMDKIGDLAVVECKGTIVSSEAALKLRDAVLAHRDARVVVVDLSQVVDFGGSGLGMLMFLQRWAHDHAVQLKWFNPSLSVRHRLKQSRAISKLGFIPLGEVMALLFEADHHGATPEHAQAMDRLAA